MAAKFYPFCFGEGKVEPLLRNKDCVGNASTKVFAVKKSCPQTAGAHRRSLGFAPG
jgi:hypothetical protein